MNSEKKKLLYLADLGSAGAVGGVHIHNRAALFQSIGFDVAIASPTPYDGFRYADSTGITHHYLNPIPGKGKIRGALWWEEELLGLSAFRQLRGIIGKVKPDAIVLYEVTSCLMIRRLMRFCKKRKIRLITEVSEWIEPRDYPYPMRLMVRKKDYQRRVLDAKIGNVIAISRYLYDHYPETCNKICIPPLFPLSAEDQPIRRHPREYCNSQLRLVFAGNAAAKDYLMPLLQVLTVLNREQIRISMDVVGPSIQEITGNLEADPESCGIFLHGRLPHEDTLKIVEQADFSVLLRENRRYAKAGVSTKFCEAMSLGVPSICTAIGGTDLFVEDGVNGFRIADNSRQEITACLERILALSSGEILTMKKNALRTARENFSCEAHAEALKKFMEC